MKLRSLFMGRRKFVAIGITAAVVVGMSVGAYAFFLSTGTGTGTGGTVGAATNWDVTVTAQGTTDLYPDQVTLPGAPGTNTQYYDLTVTNNGSGDQELQSVKLTVTPGTALCNASWFSIDGDATGSTITISGIDDNLAPGDSWTPSAAETPNLSTTGEVSIELIESGTNQSSCENVPVNLTAAAS